MNHLNQSHECEFVSIININEHHDAQNIIMKLLLLLHSIFGTK